MFVKQKDNYIKTVCSFLVGKFLSICKLSFVVGSQAIFFSASNLSMPLIGFFGGVTGATFIWAFLLLCRAAAGAFSLSTLAFYIPGYCAALYLATPSRLIRCGMPLLAIGLFLLHPVGFQAALYSGYWLIPLCIGILVPRSFFAHALGATFTAHAVGSVIWLYTVPMTPEAWLGLMPLVALERFTFAAGMVVIRAVIMRMTWFCSRLLSFPHRQLVPLTR